MRRSTVLSLPLQLVSPGKNFIAQAPKHQRQRKMFFKPGDGLKLMLGAVVYSDGELVTILFEKLFDFVPLSK